MIQCISDSVNEWNNELIKDFYESMNQGIFEPMNGSLNQSVNNHWVTEAMISINQWINGSANRIFNDFQINEPTIQWVNEPQWICETMK